MLGLGLSVLASVLLARRMVAPIRVLQEGAARIGAGDLGHRIEVRTGDELEALGDELNRTAAQLEESHATLEQKVEARTRELADANARAHRGAGAADGDERDPPRHQPARRPTSSPCSTPIAENATACATRPAATSSASTASSCASPRHGMSAPKCVEPAAAPFPSAQRRAAGRSRPRTGGWCTSTTSLARPQLPQSADLRASRTTGPFSPCRPARRRAARRRSRSCRLEPEPFTDTPDRPARQTFADQAVIAIENVRLFQELQARTHELTRSVEELRALGEVGQAVSSSLDLQSVLTSIVSHAVELSKTDAGTIYEFDESTQAFVPRANYGMTEELIEALRQSHIRVGEGAVGQAARTSAAFQIPDLERRSRTTLLRFLIEAGYRALLAVPLLREGRVIGGLVVRRKVAGTFPNRSSTCCRPSRPSRSSPSRMRGCSARSTRRAGPSRSSPATRSSSRGCRRRCRSRCPSPSSSPACSTPPARWSASTASTSGRSRPIATGSWSARGPGSARRLAGPRRSDDTRSRGGSHGRRLPRRRAAAVHETEPLPATYRLRPPYATMAGLRLKAFLVVPMIARGRTVGVLTADNR